MLYLGESERGANYKKDDSYVQRCLMAAHLLGNLVYIVYSTDDPNGLFIKPSYITGYWTVCLTGNTA